jgi:hypothetical protein
MYVGTASLDTVMKDARTTRTSKAARKTGPPYFGVQFGIPSFYPGLPASSSLAFSITALGRNEVLPFTRKWLSSKRRRNALKIKVGAASCPQLKQGVFAPLNLTDFGYAATGKVT